MRNGLELDRYRYVSRLGSGGMSSVVLAEDTLLGRRVALKRIHAPGDIAARSRLRREALIGASLTHPNLVPIFDVVSTEHGEDVIVMEYVEGGTLDDLLRGDVRPDVPRVLEVLDGVSAALDAIHAQGIVHRDVKPANILLGVDGAVKLADLGIAAVSDRTKITTTGTLLGTTSYMAPEQLDGEVATPAVDIYALAAVAFEALSGIKARREPNALALAHAIATQPPPDLRAVWPQAPAGAAAVLSRGMSRDPLARPRSAGELTARLRAAFEPQPGAAAAARPRPTRQRRRAPGTAAAGPRRSRAAVFAAAASLLTAAVVAAIVLANSGTSHQRRATGRATHVAGRRTAHSSAGQSRAATTQGSGTTAVAPTPAAPSSPSGSPINAVETFYRLAASHQYAAAWALADPSFRQELAGLQGLAATMAAERSITFNQASVVNQSPTSATVAVRTTSIQQNGTQNCSGTVDLLRGGAQSPGWLLDHIAISCV